MPDQPAFPETLWPRMRDLMEREGPPAVVALIAGHADELERRKLYSLALSAFSSREWEGKSLDAIIAIGQAGIWEGLKQADSASGEECSRLLDFANVLSYNLAATLAPCWPGDELPRNVAHFEAGLAAADDCLRWRIQLKKGAMPFAIAHWARGIHLNALGRHDEALAEHESALRRAEEVAREGGIAADASVSAPWVVLLSAGYVELGRRLAGRQDDSAFERVLRVIDEAAKTRPDEAEDLVFCADQLREAARRLPVS